MRKFTFSIICLAAAAFGQVRIPGPGGAAAAAPSGYLHYRSLTVDHTQVGSADLSNFPVLVSTTLGSSKVQNASCYDVIFAADSAGTTMYPFELESCNQSTGAINAWVKVPTVSHTSDTTLYVLYDNSAISTAQNTGSYAPAQVWSGYLTVLHMPNGSTLSTADSTGNVTWTNHSATATTGRIDGAGSFAGASSQYLSAGGIADHTQASVMFWGNVTDYTQYEAWFASTSNGGNDYTTGLVVDVSSVVGGNIRGINIEGAMGTLSWSPTVPESEWHHYAATVTSGGSVTLYIDGASQGTLSGSAGTMSFYSDFVGCRYWGGTAQRYMTGGIDEMELSPSVFSAGWVLASYNSQKSGSTFVTVGSEN